MVDFLDNAKIVGIFSVIWYVLFAGFLVWLVLTAPAHVQSALKSSLGYLLALQDYVTGIVEIILLLAAAYAVLIFLGKAGKMDTSMSPLIQKMSPSGDFGMKIIFVLLLLAVVVIAIYLRITMLQFYGFYEPDGFYHYSVIRAAVNNGIFNVPKVLSISGWPSSAPVTEAQGLYFSTLIPYAFLQFFGVSYYTVMRLMPVVFALLDMFGAYLLSRYLSRDKLLALLVIAFVGFSMGNAARTSALIYRGDTFVSFWLLIALVFFVETMRQEKKTMSIIFAVLAGVALAFSNFSWNGSPFADATFIFAFALLVVAGYILRKDQVIKDSKYLLLAMLVWFVVVELGQAAGFIGGQQLVAPSLQVLGFMIPEFIPIYIGLLFLYLFVYVLNFNSLNFSFIKQLSTPGRLAVMILFVTIGIALFTAIEPSVVYNIFIGNGFITHPGSFGTTIQELQPPNAQFLYTSFGVVMFTSLPSLSMYLPLYLNFNLNVTSPANLTTVAGSTSYNCPVGSAINQNTKSCVIPMPFWEYDVGIFAVILALILFIPYLFMQIYDSGGFLSGNARVRLDLNVGLVAIAAYFILTAYLQMHAIRFNSLVSIPLAMMGAYTIYWLISFAKAVANKRAVVFAGFALLFLVSIALVFFTGFGATNFLALVALGLGLLLGIICAYFALYNQIETSLYQAGVYMLVAFFLAGFMIVLLTNDNVYAQTLSQADSINPQFISALQWFKANSPSNSVVLTLWPDGSVVEGVANRTSVTDSVGSQNGTKADPFAAWILNSSSDPQFLTSPLSGRPNYLLVRTPWLIETQGIYTESKITENASLFGYLPITQFVEGQPNATTKQLIFRNNPTGYPFVVVDLKQIANTSQSSINGYIQLSQSQISPFQTVGFYNQDNGNFTYVPQVHAYNGSNGETFMVLYSGVPKTNFYINITGAYIFGPGIGNSNMIKFLYFCSSSACLWNNANATAQMVYQNLDTKIFKITYLH